MSTRIPVACYSTEPQDLRTGTNGTGCRQEFKWGGGLQGIREMGSVGPEANWKVVVD